jgi:Xaa-Pro aminopeptidase
MIPIRFVMLALVAGLCVGLDAQPVFTGVEIFPPEEFAARRARVLDAIGDGVAVMQGTTERPGEQPLRQSNQFFYLTGIVEPRAFVIIDGRSKRTTGGHRKNDGRAGSAPGALMFLVRAS